MRSRLWLTTYKKQLGICIEYSYISEFMLWLHQGKFVKVKWVKIPRLATLQVAKYIEKVKWCAWAFKEYSLSRKEKNFQFFGRQFSLAKSGHRREKQSVLGPDYLLINWCLTASDRTNLSSLSYKLVLTWAIAIHFKSLQ